MGGRIRLGELLVRAGVLDELKLRAALAQQQKWGGRLGKVLVDMNYVSEDVLVRALSKQLGVPRASFEGADVPQDIVVQIGSEFAEQNDVCPVHYDEGRRVLTVATTDPTNVAAIDELRFRTGLRIEPVLAGPRELGKALQQIFGLGAPYRPELPDAIELEDIPDQPIDRTASYTATMAASGLSIDPEDLATDPGQESHGKGPGPAAGDLVRRLDAAQRQQQRALRVLLDLLVEKGVFSREDYLARMTGP